LEAIETRLNSLEQLWQAIGKPISGRAISRRGHFMELLDKHISETELRDAAFESGIDYDSLPDEGKHGKARELVLQLKREGREYELIGWLQRMRPQVLWPSLDTGPLDQGKT